MASLTPFPSALLLLLPQQDASEEDSDQLLHGARDSEEAAEDGRARAPGKKKDDVADHAAAQYLHFARIKKSIEDIEGEDRDPSEQVLRMAPEACRSSLQEGESGMEEEEKSNGDEVRYNIRGEEGDLIIINQEKGAAQGELENAEDIEIDVMGRQSVGLHLLMESASDA